MATDIDDLEQRVIVLENAILAIIQIFGISRQRLAQEFGVTLPSAQ